MNYIFISVRDFCKCCGDFVAVDHITFDVKRGEIFGFLGANGAGKTTTIKSMLGLVHPDGGEIRYLAAICPAREADQAADRVFYGSSQLLSKEKNKRHRCCYKDVL